MRMQSGSMPWGGAREALTKVEYEDEVGNLFRCYPIANNPELAKPIPILQTLGRSDQRRSEEEGCRRLGRGSTWSKLMFQL